MMKPFKQQPSIDSDPREDRRLCERMGTITIAAESAGNATAYRKWQEERRLREDEFRIEVAAANYKQQLHQERERLRHSNSLEPRHEQHEFMF